MVGGTHVDAGTGGEVNQLLNNGHAHLATYRKTGLSNGVIDSADQSITFHEVDDFLVGVLGGFGQDFTGDLGKGFTFELLGVFRLAVCEGQR
ncbi:hypothetical protein D3C81_1734020 [compost metagenome]